MKRILVICGIIGSIVVLALVVRAQLSHNSLKEEHKTMNINEQLITESEELMLRLRKKATEGLEFAKNGGLDVDHAFLVDFSIHSGKKRFFVWDYKADTIAFSSLCAHGTGKGNHRSTPTKIKYSNVEGSLCSSLGKYKTGIRSYSNWGINVHYKLHGLEETNDNAFRRIVVLHSYAPVPDEEIYPAHLPLGYSQGCPVVDDGTMTKIDNMMKEKKQSVLLWIYE